MPDRTAYQFVNDAAPSPTQCIHAFLPFFLRGFALIGSGSLLPHSRAMLSTATSITSSKAAVMTTNASVPTACFALLAA